MCFEDQPAENVAKIMAEHGVRRLPVLDRRGRLTGVVSLSDVNGGALRKNKPYAVTFYKQLTDGCGHCTRYRSGQSTSRRSTARRKP